MPQPAPSRYLPLIIVMVLGAVVLVAVLWLLNRDDGNGRSTPAAAPDSNTASALPAGPSRSVEDEIACIDRLMAGNVPAGTNMQAAFESCRYVPAPDANMADVNMSAADLPMPLNGAAAG